MLVTISLVYTESCAGIESVMTPMQKNYLYPTVTAAQLKLAAIAGLVLGWGVLLEAGALAATDKATMTGSVQVNTAAQPTYSTEQIQNLPQLANIQISAKDVRVIGTPPDVTVLAQAHAKEQDSELKIDAMFIAKAIIEGTNGQTRQVKVVFSEDSGDGRYINIPKRVITDFTGGKVHADQLLSGLVLLNVHHEEAPKVAQGPEFERRLVDWQRIQRLKERGTGVSSYEREFKQVEVLAKANNQEAMVDGLDALEAKVKILEDNAKQAAATARGHGIQGTVTHLLPPLPGASNAATAEGGGNFPLPPDSDRLKALFTEKATSWVGMISSRNSQQGQQARSLKTQIEQNFASGNKGMAFHLLHDLQTMLQQVTGYDPFAPEGGMPQGGPGGPGMGQGQGGPGMGQGGPGMGQGGPGMGQGGPGTGQGGPGMGQGGPGMGQGGPGMQGGPGFGPGPGGP